MPILMFRTLGVRRIVSGSRGALSVDLPLITVTAYDVRDADERAALRAIDERFLTPHYTPGDPQVRPDWVLVGECVHGSTIVNAAVAWDTRFQPLPPSPADAEELCTMLARRIYDLGAEPPRPARTTPIRHTTIHKQRMLTPRAGVHTLTVPKGARIISANTQYGGLCIWYECDPKSEPVQTAVMLVATGGERQDGWHFIDTVLLEGGTYVLHVYALHVYAGMDQ